MKYKLVKPEDFTDIEGYAFKLSKAYSVLYADFLNLLVRIHTTADMIGVELKTEDDLLFVKDKLNEFIKDYINE